MAKISIKPRGGGRKKFVVGTNRTPVKIVAHGDSITAAVGSYVENIKADTEAAKPVTTTVVNAAVSGQGFLYLYTNVQAQVLALNPDIVIICSLLNDLYNDPGVKQNAIDYITACRAHVNPNGKNPIVIGMTDNAASSTAAGRPANLQDRAQVLIMEGYNTFSANPNVFIVDNYAAFIALVRDSATFLSKLNPDETHPNAAGQTLIRNTMQTALMAAVQKFLTP